MPPDSAVAKLDSQARRDVTPFAVGTMAWRSLGRGPPPATWRRGSALACAR